MNRQTKTCRYINPDGTYGGTFEVEYDADATDDRADQDDEELLAGLDKILAEWE